MFLDFLAMKKYFSVFAYVFELLRNGWFLVKYSACAECEIISLRKL